MYGKISQKLQCGDWSRGRLSQVLSIIFGLECRPGQLLFKMGLFGYSTSKGYCDLTKYCWRLHALFSANFIYEDKNLPICRAICHETCQIWSSRCPTKVLSRNCENLRLHHAQCSNFQVFIILEHSVRCNRPRNLMNKVFGGPWDETHLPSFMTNGPVNCHICPRIYTYDIWNLSEKASVCTNIIASDHGNRWKLRNQISCIPRHL